MPNEEIKPILDLLSLIYQELKNSRNEMKNMREELELLTNIIISICYPKEEEIDKYSDNDITPIMPIRSNNLYVMPCTSNS